MPSASREVADLAARCPEIAVPDLPDRPHVGDIATNGESHIMKRSRRIVLTLMGSAAVSAATTKLAAARGVLCGPGYSAVPSASGVPNCQVTSGVRPGGFGDSFHHVHGHGHGHAGG
jgi:hypothetical protein